MATELGVAYVAIVPTTKGMATAIGKEISGSAVASAAKTGGQHIGTNLASSVRSVLSGNMHISDVALNAGKSIGSHLADGVKQAGSMIADGMKSAVVNGTKAAGVAIAGLAVGVGALGKAALDSYADYQQLTGGVTKLFGDADSMVMDYANKAFASAGMSANQYMETVTGFSASLISSLGGDTTAAAELADTAIRDMSDNANTFGTDMASVQAAYQGFAKQNYSMLDNLKLGYGGSASEMMKLINDSGVLEEQLTDVEQVADVGFATIVEAIHAIQEGQNIAGTTAKEAASTISGSFDMLRASWGNFITYLGDDSGKVGEAVQQVATSMEAVLANVGKVLPVILENISAAIPTLLPLVLDQLVQFVGMIVGLLPTIIPPLIDAVMQVLQIIVDTLPAILPALISGTVQIIVGIAQMLPTLAPMLGQAAKQLFDALSDALPLILPALIDATVALVMAAVDLLPTLIPQLLSAAIQLFMALVEAVGRIVGELLGKVGEVIGQAVGKVSGSAGEMLSAAVEWFMGLLKGAQQVAADIINFVANIPGNILAALGNLGSLLWDAGGQIINGLLGGLQAAFGGVMDFVGGIAGWIFEHKGPLEYDATLLVKNGAVIMEGLETGLREGYKDVQRFVAGVGTNIQATVTGEVSSNQSTTAGFGGVLITGNTFNVRSESDIDRISDALARKINRDAWAVV